VGAAVLWSIGWSMVVLSGLVFLPRRAVAAFGIIMIASHNAFDGVQPGSWGRLDWLWIILHYGGPFNPAPNYTFIAAYPLVPWIGVMAAGYGFGSVLLKPTPLRRAWMLGLGIGLVILFAVIRFTNLYGNPRPWSTQSRPLYTLFSFIDCHKYPPSLLYVLMTLGPALIVLWLLDRASEGAEGEQPGSQQTARQPTRKLLRPLLVFGRVPLFYYLLHLPLIHGLAVVVARIRFGRADWLFANPFASQPIPVPPNNGFDLPIVYLIWMGVILVLYPICRWFAAFKARHRSPWLSYL
jgi:uncharacterized membrane protein